MERFKQKTDAKLGKLHKMLFFSQSANSDGKFHYSCNKQYFVSSLSVAKTKLAAESECCKYGMKLLYIESEDEIKCLGDLNNSSVNIIKKCATKFTLNKSQMNLL